MLPHIRPSSSRATHERGTADCSQHDVALHPFADRTLAENEKLWQALSAEFDAATAELSACTRASELDGSRADRAAIDRAIQRCQVVEAAINTFLDALDHGG